MAQFSKALFSITSILVCGALTSNAFAALGGAEADRTSLLGRFGTGSGSLLGQTNQTSVFETNNWYNIEKTVSVYPRDVMDEDGEIDPLLNNIPISLVPGTTFNVIQMSEDKAHALIAFNNAENQDQNELLPMQMWVQTDDLIKGQPSFLEFNDDQDSDEDDDVEASLAEPNYIETDVAGRSSVRRGRAGLNRKKVYRPGKGLGRVIRIRSRNGMTFCLGEVRANALSICRTRAPQLERAAIAYSAYRAAGWIPVQYSPDTNSNCTACFWDGGRQDCSGGVACGHAALKVGPDRWVGAGIRANPRLPDQEGCKRGRNGRKLCRVPYVLQGCLVPPGSGS